MLDVETKNRINTARDILVGKVPDPKSQVEQITIALIYKFMDDMDLEAEELGGKRTFFVNGFSKYSWRKIFDPRLSGYELLNLYGEAITKMDTNPGVPKLFRDIFKNAYLPYRDPETLKSFLKVIHEFEYTHSEKLGDAFEYLLSILDSQGDAGQFRTPRHLIDFMVGIIDPKKDESILDPACGTSGFLISSYRHIIKHNSSVYKTEGDRERSQNSLQSLSEHIINSNGYNGDLLSSEDRRRLVDNIYGYDISPDMVRLSLVNMYLHGIKEPHIAEYDTLTSEDNWNHYSDVILANPPFMSPKGGIRPHKRFSIQCNRSEVLFVDYIIEHLTPKGRTAIIVPEGIIFQTGSAYKNLRKLLIDEGLYAVVSLPSGMFNPYSQVKTSILFLDKALSKAIKSVLFYKVEKDGTDLGAKRLLTGDNDLPLAKRVISSFINALRNSSDFTLLEGSKGTLVQKSRILKDNMIFLSANQYKEINTHLLSGWESLPLNKFCRIEKGKSSSTKTIPGVYPLVLTAKERKTSDHFDFEGEAVLIPLISSTGHGKASLKTIHIQKGRFAAADLLGVIFPDKQTCLPEFLYHCIDHIKDGIAKQKMQGAANVSMKITDLSDIEIPVPHISYQEHFISEISSYQNIIDGARMVVENYKPRVEIDPEWEMVELGNVTEVISGYAFDSKDFTTECGTKCIKITNVGIREFVIDNEGNLPGTFLGKYSKYAANTNDIVIALTRTIISGGLKVAKVPPEWNNSLVNQRVACIKPSKSVATDYLYLYLTTDAVHNYIQEKSRSLMQPNLSIIDLKRLPVPIPPNNIQAQIISQVKEVRSLIDANWKLISIYEEKIKDRIAKVWGE